MNSERLHELANLLDELPPEKLNMSIWETNCGSVCCALGHACYHEPFIKEGLRMVARFPNDAVSAAYKVPDFRGRRGYFAAVGFFEIPLCTAEYIFSPTFNSSRPKPTYVASRIREVVRNGSLTDTFHKPFESGL